MKPLFMSWKTYAKKLELEIKEIAEEGEYLSLWDSTIKKHLIFPDMDTIINYVKFKAKFNSKMSESLIYGQDIKNIGMEVFNRTEININAQATAFFKDLESYICDNGIYPSNGRG